LGEETWREKLANGCSRGMGLSGFPGLSPMVTHYTKVPEIVPPE
jgi:hypothetical protein